MKAHSRLKRARLYVRSRSNPRARRLLQYMWAKKFAALVGPKGVSVAVFDPGQVYTHNELYDVLKKLTKCLFPCMLYMMGTRMPEAIPQIVLWALADGTNGMAIDANTFNAPLERPPVPLGTFPGIQTTAYSKPTPLHSTSVEDPDQVERLWDITEEIRKKLSS